MSGDAAPTKAMKDLADALYQSPARERIGAKDVRVWKTGRSFAGEDQVVVAFAGDPLKIKNHVLTRGVPNYRNSFDLDLQRALGLPAETNDRGFPRSQYFPDGDILAGDLTDGLAALSNRALGAEEAVVVTLMPDSGDPWSPHNTPTPYYSAKSRAVGTSTLPAWAQKVEIVGEPPQLGADFCAHAPYVGGCPGGAVVGAMDRSRTPLVFIATHSLSLEEGQATRETARAIRDCGGLLFPSIAVGMVPATNFGELVLVADVLSVLQGLRPYKKRGRWPITVYASDAWTATTSTFVGRGAVELFEELTGSPDTNWIYKTDFWSLGPPIADEKARVIPSTKKLRSVLTRRAKLYPRGATADDLSATRMSHFDREGAYPYVEAKVNAIMEMSCFPLAVAPRGQTARARRFLKAAGWKGELITVAPPVAEADEAGAAHPSWDYAWRVRDAVIKWASARGRVTGVSE